MNDVSAYQSAANFFVSAVERVPAGAWTKPGIGEWTVRELVGHTCRSLTLLGEYLHHPVAQEQPGSPYFSPEAIAQRGREASEALGDDPVVVVSAARNEVVLLVESIPADTVFGTPFGSLPLATYLPMRTAELVIHTLDLLQALTALGVADAELEPPADALAEALRFVASRAATKKGAQVLFALSGRGSLPEGYSVY